MAAALALACAWQLALAPRCHGETSDGSDAIEAGRDALDSSVDFPWYDEDTDAITHFDVERPADMENRKSQWEVRESNWDWDWRLPDWWWQFVKVVGWTLVALLLGWLVYMLVRAFLSREQGTAANWMDDELATDTRGDVDRVESLPFQIKRPQADLLAEARRHYEAGDYAEAIIYLYSYQLVQLDRNQFIRLTKGKTNRQYLREVRRRSELFKLLSRTMLTFEDVFFGNHTLERKQFEVCWEGLDEFHERLEGATV